MEQLDYNLLPWFVGLSMGAPVWDVTVFTRSRERLPGDDVAARLTAAVLAQPRVKALLSDDRFTVDRILIEAFASLKSFRLKDETSRDGPGTGGGRNGRARQAAPLVAAPCGRRLIGPAAATTVPAGPRPGAMARA